MMTPAAAYKRLNRVLWLNRLPECKIVVVDDAVIPLCRGITIYDDDFAKPVIFLNRSLNRWGRTLIHEMIHVAEPQLMHGQLFNSLVLIYWRIARTKISAMRDL